jgi:rhodanese-related sulfurtransferase
MKNIIGLVIIVLSYLGLSACDAPLEKNGSSQNRASVQHIDAATFEKMLTDTNVVVVDVRTPGEVSEGFIKGASIFADINSSEFDAIIKTLAPGKKYLVYCRSGARSSRASNQMIANGLTEVYNLRGGIMNYTGTISR